MQTDGSYTQRRPVEADAKGSQEQLIELAEKRQRDARAVRKRRSEGGLMRRARR